MNSPTRYTWWIENEKVYKDKQLLNLYILRNLCPPDGWLYNHSVGPCLWSAENETKWVSRLARHSNGQVPAINWMIKKKDSHSIAWGSWSIYSKLCTTSVPWILVLLNRELYRTTVLEVWMKRRIFFPDGIKILFVHCSVCFDTPIAGE